MPQEDRDPFDFLVSSVTSLSEELRRYSRGFEGVSNDFADKVERGFNDAANTIRSVAYHASWVPDSIRPPPPPKPCPVHHASYLERVGIWIDRHRAITAAVVAFFGTSAFLIWRHRRLQRQKRRAKRAPNGAKTELVVLAGSPHSPITKAVALDLERKGFLVYIPVGSLEEEAAISDLRAPDVHSLNFDITSPESTAEMLEKLSDFLQNPKRHGTKRLHFASLILLEGYPSTHSTGQITDLSVSAWSDTLNTHILYPISLVQAFLPLLTTESISSPPPRAFSSRRDPDSPPTSLLFITPSTLSSLHVPLHAPESLATAALTSYLTTLRLELPPSLPLIHIRLGSFKPLAKPFDRLDLALLRLGRLRSSSDSSGYSGSSPAPRRYDPELETVAFTPATSRGALRELHNGIFDAIVGRTSGTVFLGRGARTYAYVGAWIPSGLAAKMMGYRHASAGRSSGVERSRSQDSVGRSVEWERVEG